MTTPDIAIIGVGIHPFGRYEDRSALDKARKELAQSICDRLDNQSYMVIVTELIGEPHLARLGKWGVHEPVPATVPVPPPPPPEAATK